MRERGRFIVFEGLDGSGKTTQLDLLSQRFTERKEVVAITREPSDSNPVGVLTRRAMEGAHTLQNETLAMLFAADRFQHVTEVILPMLHTGTQVLCDRYYFSNFAYQGDETPLERLIGYNAQVMRVLRPDLTLFIDLDPEECLRRIQQRRSGEAGIYENIAKLKRVRARYLDAFARLRDTENIAVIDTQGLNAAEVAARVWLEVDAIK